MKFGGGRKVSTSLVGVGSPRGRRAIDVSIDFLDYFFKKIVFYFSVQCAT